MLKFIIYHIVNLGNIQRIHMCLNTARVCVCVRMPALKFNLRKASKQLMETTVTKKDILLLSLLDISTPIPNFRVEENLRTLGSKHDNNPPSVNTSLRNRFYFLSLSRRKLRPEKVTCAQRRSVHGELAANQVSPTP